MSTPPMIRVTPRNRSRVWDGPDPTNLMAARQDAEGEPRPRAHHLGDVFPRVKCQKLNHPVGSLWLERVILVSTAKSGARIRRAVSAVMRARAGSLDRWERWARTMWRARPSKSFCNQSARSSFERCPVREKMRCFNSHV